MIEAIVFDFDGVITDSNRIKSDGFYMIFNNIEGAEKIIKTVKEEYPRENRYGIIERVLKILEKDGKIKYEDLQTEVQKYAKSYAEITEKGQIEADEIKGAKEALKRLKEKGFRLFLHTATTDDSIKKVIEARGLKDYFEGIYGSSRGDKIAVLQLIINENKLSKDKIISIGDGNTELEAAKELGIIFVALANESNNFSERNDFKYMIHDNLTELFKVVEEIDKNG